MLVLTFTTGEKSRPSFLNKLKTSKSRESHCLKTKLLPKSETPLVVKTHLEEVRMSHFALLLLLLQPHSHNGWHPISEPQRFKELAEKK